MKSDGERVEEEDTEDVIVTERGGIAHESEQADKVVAIAGQAVGGQPRWDASAEH